MNDELLPLMMSVKMGSESALHELMKRTRRNLLFTAQEICPLYAEDALSDTAWKCWQGKFDQSKGAVYPWMKKLVRNYLFNVLERPATRTYDQIPEDHTTHFPECLKTTISEHDPFLWKAINNLPDRYREAVLLRDLYGFREMEAAEYLGQTRSEHGWNIRTGRQAVRDELMGGPKKAKRFGEVYA